jgi:short-subunit dehydrogenase involved in D-alanine esterification of teichoic acids
MCDHTAKFINSKSSLILRSVATADQFEEFVNDLVGKYSSLNNNINGIPVPREVKTILHDARKARNDIAHSLTIGWTGCMDTKIKEKQFKKQISELVIKVAAGDIMISLILSVLNKERNN